MPEIMNIRVATNAHSQSIIIDFSNDQHYEMAIRSPYGPEQVADALRDLSEVVRGHEGLRGA